MSISPPPDPGSFQAVFALSMFSNAVQRTQGEQLGQLAYELISKALSNAAPTIGQWDIVWGPAVNSQPVGKELRMNTLYLARSHAQPDRYVLAMAGTNPYSLLDWLVEDGFVFAQVPWVYGLLEAPDAKIALGTAIGLVTQQNLCPEAGLPGAGTRVLDALRSAAKEPANLAVAGHSLGGALAPTMAMWLADTAGIPFLWDPHRHVTISVLPTAGPTPGNGAFAAHTVNRLGARLTPFYNQIDVVPQAWQEAGSPSLAAIPGIYAPEIEPFDLLSTLVGVAELLAKNGDYTPFSGAAQLAGTFNNAVFDPSKSDLQNFLAQLAYQHVPAYSDWFEFDPSWMPKEPTAPPALSPTLSEALSQPSASVADVRSALFARAPRSLQIGDTVTEAPRGPADPQTARVVALVETELRKQGSTSSAA